MTAPDIRAQAIEVLARASYAAWKDQYDQFEREAGGGNFAPDYDDSRRWPERELTIKSATRSVDALAEAGLLPTEVEEYTSRTWGQAEPVSQRRRYVTEWREVGS